MPPFALSWNADISHNAANSSPWHQDTLTLHPYFVQFGKETLVLDNVAELRRIAGSIFLEVPVRR